MASKRRSQKGSDLAAARCIALRLPGVDEGTSYGTPAFRVRGKLFCRLHEDGEFLVVRSGFEQREALVAADPDRFRVTDHYRNHPYVLVRLSTVPREVLTEVLTEAWRQRAPARWVAALDGGAEEVPR